MRRPLAILAAALMVELCSTCTARADSDIGELVLRVSPTGYVAYTNTLARPVNGSAAYVRVNAGATLTADSASWPDGASVLAVVNPLGSYTVASSLQLVGYGPWPTNAFQMVAWRLGSSVRCNIISEFASAPSVTYGSDGPAPASSPVGWTYLSATAVYQSNGNAVDLVLASGDTLAVSTTGWIDGQSMLVAVHPAGSYTVASNIALVGYGSWPTDDFYAVIWRVGNTFYINLVN